MSGLKRAGERHDIYSVIAIGAAHRRLVVL
jgi:hypothetical protein